LTNHQPYDKHKLLPEALIPPKRVSAKQMICQQSRWL